MHLTLLPRTGNLPAAELEGQRVKVRIPGRIVTLRLHGKAGFAHIQASMARGCRSM